MWIDSLTTSSIYDTTPTPTQTTEVASGLFVERRLWEDDAAREACALCLRVGREVVKWWIVEYWYKDGRVYIDPCFGVSSCHHRRMT